MFILKLSLALIATQLALLFIIWIRTKRRRRDTRSGLFRFNDGINNRSVDPITTLLSLEGHKELLLHVHPEQARDGNKDAIRICTDAIQTSFGVSPFIDSKQPGLTVTEMLNLLAVFVYYCETQKKVPTYRGRCQPLRRNQRRTRSPIQLRSLRRALAQSKPVISSSVPRNKSRS